MLLVHKLLQYHCFGLKSFKINVLPPCVFAWGNFNGLSYLCTA